MRRTLLFVTLMLAALASIQTQAITVYYNNPGNWSDVSAYFYKGQQNSKAWPGHAMTKVGDLYQIDVPTGFEDGMVIFNNNDNGQQYPASGNDGKQLANKSMICLNNSIWTVYEDAAFKVYFDNSYANWAGTVKLHYFGASSSVWENPVEMTQITGTDIWEYTVPAGTGGLVFRNAALDAQSSDLAAVKGHVYSNSADLGEYVAETQAEPFKVYFDNWNTGWEVPYVYYWGGSTPNSYPGTAMTAVAGKPGIYEYTVSARTKKVLFTDGSANADATKTPDWDAKEGYVYVKGSENGWVAELDDYTRNVNAPATLYILTNQGVEPMSPTGAAMTKSGNTFTISNVKIDVAELNGDCGYFSFAVASADNWDAVNAAKRFGPASDVNGANAVTAGTAAAFVEYSGWDAPGCKSFKIAPATYTFTVDFEAMTVTATQTGSGPVAGTGTINVPAISIKKGASEDLRVVLDTETQMVALQFDIKLPSVVTAGAPRLSDLTADHHVESSVIAGGATRFIITSDNNTPFTRGKGILLYIPVTAAADAAVGDYDVTVENIILSDVNLLKATLTAGTIGQISIEENDDISIALNKSEVALQVGQSETLVATVTCAGTAPAVTWRSNDTAVATVDANGKVTAVANGTAVITATAGTAKATCNVTVGKNAQTITWNQVLQPKYKIGATETLTATTDAAGVDVTFVVTAGNAYGHIDVVDGVYKFTADAAGIVTIQARAAGNDNYAPANPVTRQITVWLGYKLGDTNGDENYTIEDATVTIQHILGKNPADFNDSAADVNGDGDIDVVDVTRIIDLVLKNKPAGGQGAPQRVESQEGLEQFAISSTEYTLRVDFTNMGEYVATQFDLAFPEGNEIKAVTLAGSDHRVAFHNDADYSRVVAYSYDNEAFAPNGYFTITLKRPLSGPAILSNALVNRLQGDDVIETAANGASCNGVTGIESVAINAGDCEVYTVDGICIYRGAAEGFNAPAGLYIVRTADKTVKVIK